MAPYIVQIDLNGQDHEFPFKKRKYAEMEYRRYCAMRDVFSASLWFIPADEDKEPYIIESFERE